MSTPEYQSLEEIDPKITLLLKGPPGSGKTWLTAHIPDVVIVNIDNNLAGLKKLSLERRKNIRILNPRFKKGKKLDGAKAWDNFIEVLADVAADPSVRVIVIDSLTTLAEIIMDKIVGTSQPTAKVQIQHYGEFTRYMKWFGDDFLCAQDLDKHIIFTAHEQLIVDEITKEVRYVLNMSTKMRDSFDLYFTDCWRTYVETPLSGPTKYKIQTLPGKQFNAKCSAELPKQFELNDELENIKKIFA